MLCWQFNETLAGSKYLDDSLRRSKPKGHGSQVLSLLALLVPIRCAALSPRGTALRYSVYLLYLYRFAAPI
jgi:hypothetical protein